jgi:hypothetical protein
MGWGTEQCPEGTVIVIEGYQIIDPEEYSDVFNDRWIKRYSTALIKRQWGENMKKFGQISLPGGVTLNGDRIYQEAVDEISTLENEMLVKYSEPPEFMIG